MDTYKTYKLTVASPVALAALNGIEEFEFVGDGTVTVLHVHTDVQTDGNPDWGMPFETVTTVTVAAERWHGSMDDDGDGEPVTDVGALAALLGCGATATAVASCVHDWVMDRALSRWEARYD